MCESHFIICITNKVLVAPFELEENVVCFFFLPPDRMVRKLIETQALVEEFYIWGLAQRSSTTEPPFWAPESGPRVAIPASIRFVDPAYVGDSNISEMSDEYMPLVFEEAWIRIITVLKVRAHDRRQFTVGGQVLKVSKAGNLQSVIGGGARFITVLW